MDSIVLTGAPLERGTRFGEAYGAVMRDHAARQRPPSGWPAYRYGHVSARHLYYNLDHAPELVDEMRGIGNGAGIGFETAFYLSCAAALGYARDDTDSCTNFAAVTTDRGPMLGKTEDPGADVGPDFASNYVVQKVKPDRGYRYLAITRKYNIWTSTGMNEHGLAIGQSSGPLRQGDQDGSGINYLLLMRPVMERCRTVEEGVELLGSLKMAGKAFLFMLADAEGGMAAVEKWYDRQAVRGPTDQPLYFANAFVDPTMQDFPPRYDAENAAYRFANLEGLFRGAAGNGGYTSAFMHATLCNHAEQGSVCRHGQDSPVDGNGLSGPGFMYYCRERRVAIYPGLPCTVDPVWVDFDF